MGLARLIIASGLLLVGCGRDDVDSRDRIARLESVRATPSATLEVTWLVPGQPPQTTQTQFSNVAACEGAKQAAIAAGNAARVERINENERDKGAVQREQAEAGCGFGCSPSPAQLEKLRGVPPPSVSAVCLVDGAGLHAAPPRN